MLKIKRLIKYTGLLSIITLLAACNQTINYEKSEIVENASWPAEKIFEFSPKIEDSELAYNFYINLRNNNKYPYSNLYLFLETQFPDKTLSRDTLEFYLADKSGKWLGKGHGRVKESDFLIREAFLFPQSGDYMFSISHGMRADTLIGIEDVGIRIEKAEINH